MQSTLKITSLVAVLGLCLAALAGSAYAYTATYVDTIEDQPIENVYVTINGKKNVATYGTTSLDLDVEYNYLNKTVNTESGIINDFYMMERATVNNKSPSEVTGVTAVVENNVATFTINLFEFTLKAYGDKTFGTLKISGFPTVDSTNAKITYKYGNDDLMPGEDGSLSITNITLDPADEETSTKTFAITMVVEISPIDTGGTSATYGDKTYYTLKSEISGPITIDGTEFSAVFTATQATA